METAICSKYNKEKPLSLDYWEWRNNQNKWRSQCRECKSSANKKWRDCNKVKRLAYNQKYVNENRANVRDYHRKYGAEHKRKIRSIPENKVRCYISNHIRYCLKRACGLKDGFVFDALPYTSTELKLHLENNFEYWMTWDNWGVYRVELWDDNDSTTWTWQIDHITPTVLLPYDSMNHPNFQKCWSLDNLRPFKSKDNLCKGDRIE